ncbi:MAG: hypothetical protein D3923_06410 [Candidatus Electrothrix sp. AR3]|nr:hypothetical protein [Candidatus Electrothrix sp. AR3]
MEKIEGGGQKLQVLRDATKNTLPFMPGAVGADLCVRSKLSCPVFQTDTQVCPYNPASEKGYCFVKNVTEVRNVTA